MEIREIVRLRPGTGGLDPPLNFGILLDREKTSRDHLAVVYTMNGELKLKPKSIKESTGEVYRGSKKSHRSMQEALKRIIDKEKRSKILKMDPRSLINDTTPEMLWRSVLSFIGSGRTHLGLKYDGEDNGVHGTMFCPEEIGKIHFEPHFLDTKQIKSVAKVLSLCDDRREPFFLNVNVDNRPHYVPYTKETLKDIEADVRRLEELRSSFIEWRELENEESGRTDRKPVLKERDISSVVLDELQEKEMERVLSWSKFYLEEGRWPARGDIVQGLGLAGTSVTRVRRFDLERFIEFFAIDLTSTRKGYIASNLLTMLLKFGRIKMREASELVVLYKIASGAQKFRSTFPEHVLKEAERIPPEVGPEDGGGRVDLTDLETYTIDPVDAKDFDDAVSIVTEEDRYIVHVHIADVTHYVGGQGLIDLEARTRATSVYLPTGVLPMLPPKLSEDLCSLREKVRRLAMSTRMVFDRNTLELMDHGFFPSVIRVDRNLSYEDVEKSLDEKGGPFSSLQSLTEKLDGRFKRLDIGTSERKVGFLDDDEIELSIKMPTRSTKMIETLMVLTNELVASYLEEREIPNSYRVHPIPDITAVERFNSAARALDLEMSIEVNWQNDRKGGVREVKGEVSLVESLLKGGRLTLGAHAEVEVDSSEPREDEAVWSKPSPEDMKKAVDAYDRVIGEINELEGGRIPDLLRMRLLRTMPRAFYSSSNMGHFGLNSLCYGHFTSPIRRYSDIVMHRALKLELSGEVREDEKNVPWIEELLETINEMSDDAEKWEREMIDVALATKMEMDPLLRDGIHKGTISSITPSSIYVSLDDGASEGRISLRHLAKGRLTVDEMETMVLLEERDGSDPLPILKIGDMVRCRIHSTSIAEGRIELSIAQNLGISQSSP